MAPEEGDASPVVVAYRLGQVEQAVKHLGGEMKDTLAALVEDLVSKERHDLEMDAVHKNHDKLAERVDHLEQNRTAGNRWAATLAVSIIAALISLAAVGAAVVAIVLAPHP